MKSRLSLDILPCMLIFVLSACAPDVASPVASAPVEIPSPPSTTPPKPTALSFVPTVYKDESNGFELDYPSGWTVVPNTPIGSRGATAQLSSPGSTAETLADGGSRVNVTIYLWDPKNDLAAYVNHRRTAWLGSVMTIVKESGGDFVDGSKYATFVVQSSVKQKAFFLITTIGDKYLEISGEGNLMLVEEIALTFRRAGSKP